MKPTELDNRQLQPEGRPPERKAKLQRLERNRERLHAELLRRLGMVER